MERIKGINFQRVKWCCDDFGITVGDLAAQMGIDKGRFDQRSLKQDGLTFRQLQEMARFFGRGVLFFLEDGPVDVASFRTPQFRSLANVNPDLTPDTKLLIERVETHRRIYLGLLEEIDAKQESRRFAPPKINHERPAEAGGIVRRWLGLDDDPKTTRDFSTYRRAIEDKGVLVLQSMGYQGAWRIAEESPIIGFSLSFAICPVILIRKQIIESRETFTLAHELGHLILHRQGSITTEASFWSGGRLEWQANAFAGHLLVPEPFLKLITDHGRPQRVQEMDDWLAPYRRRWGVSTEVILRRLMDAGRLPRDEYEAYHRWSRTRHFPKKDGGIRQYRHREPIHIFGLRYVRAVFDALSARQITLNKASGYLDNLKIGDVRKLEGYLAGT